MEVTTALFRETSPVPLKYALSLLGLMSASVRLPLVQLAERSGTQIAAVVRAISARYADGVILPQAKHLLSEQA